jgi:hypothetical protein
MVGIVQKRVGGAILCRRLNVDEYCFSLPNIPDRNYQEPSPHFLIPYPLKLGKCICSWLVDNVVITDARTGNECDVTNIVSMAATLQAGNLYYLIIAYQINSFLWFF